MLELSGGTGEFIWPSIETMAAYAKLDPRTVQRLIHAHIDARRNERVRGLLERGALSELAPGSGARHKTVTYRLNLEALPDDPVMVRYLLARQQRSLPGIRRQPINGEPIPEQTPVTPRHRGGRVTPPGGTPDSKAIDSKTIPLIPPSGELTPRQLKELSREMDRIAAASAGTHVTEEQLLRAACERTLIPLDSARVALARSRGEQTGNARELFQSWNN